VLPGYVRGKINAFTAQDPAQAEASRDQARETGPGLFLPWRGSTPKRGRDGPPDRGGLGPHGHGKSSRSRALARKP